MGGRGDTASNLVLHIKNVSYGTVIFLSPNMIAQWPPATNCAVTRRAISASSNTALHDIAHPKFAPYLLQSTASAPL